jgi:hypothetical protein
MAYIHTGKEAGTNNMAANLVKKKHSKHNLYKQAPKQLYSGPKQLPVDTILHLYVDDKYRYMYIVDQCTYVYQGLA